MASVVHTTVKVQVIVRIHHAHRAKMASVVHTIVKDRVIVLIRRVLHAKVASVVRTIVRVQVIVLIRRVLLVKMVSVVRIHQEKRGMHLVLHLKEREEILHHVLHAMKLLVILKLVKSVNLRLVKMIVDVIQSFRSATHSKVAIGMIRHQPFLQHIN